MLNVKLKDFRIILASQSPRRQQLLKDLDIDFDVVVVDYHETFPESLNGDEIARFIAHAKALSFRNKLSDKEIVITADTIVWCNSSVLGKPLNAGDAFRILNQLAGETHEVITGVCLMSNVKEKVFSVSTKVTFDPVSEEEINYYIELYKPYDKAGAYGIQEWIGLIGCSHIEGSYFNVMGLPVQALYRQLETFIE